MDRRERAAARDLQPLCAAVDYTRETRPYFTFRSRCGGD